MIVKGVRVFFAIFLLYSVSIAPGEELAVLTAFEKDVADFSRHFAMSADAKALSTRGFRSFVCNNHTGVVAVCGSGLQESAVTCDTAIMKRGARRVISVGVAGSLAEPFSPGDVILVTNVACSDRGTWTATAGFVPSTKQQSVPFNDDYLSRFRSCFVSNLAAAGITCRESSIVSGNSFVASSDRRALLAEQFSSGIVDMNSAGLLESCAAHRVPLMIVRVVSDNADEHARADFDAFVSRRESIRRVLDLMSSSLKSTMGTEE